MSPPRREMVGALLLWEARAAGASVRRAARRPSRRALWLVVVGLGAAAFVCGALTSDAGSRNLGAWTPRPLVVAFVAAGIMMLAAVVGARTPTTYGTRVADGIWWRYAGAGEREGHRATTVILVLRTAVLFAAVAIPSAAAFASVAPQRAVAILAIALFATTLAPLSVAVGAAFAPRPADDDGSEHHVPRVEPRASAQEHPATGAPREPRVPPGPLAARWLVARLRRQRPVPLVPLFVGLAAGAIVSRLMTPERGQTAALVAVIGPVALILRDALRPAAGLAALRSPWWRASLGIGPRAVVAWALADTVDSVLFWWGTVVAFGIVHAVTGAAGALPAAVLALPLLLVAPAMFRLIGLAVDVAFPAALDRRSSAAVVRVMAALIAIAAVAVPAWSVAAAGVVAMLVVATIVAGAFAATAAVCVAWRISRVHG